MRVTTPMSWRNTVDNSELDKALDTLNKVAEQRITIAARAPSDFPPLARAAIALGNEQAVFSLSSALKNRCDGLWNEMDGKAADFANLVEAATVLNGFNT